MMNTISNYGAEISWFAPICNGDDEYLGDHDPNFKSSWENTSKIVLKADKLGFRNILCPSSYQVGQDTMTFASAIAPLTQRINLLTAIRCGEIHPPMLARSIATLDHILKGRLTLNIISSDLPGSSISSELRYQRSSEVIQILKQGWNQECIDFKGEFYNINLPSDPVKPYQQNGGPLLYFGGYSPSGVELCAKYGDVYLMWPETILNLKNHIKNLRIKSKKYNRELNFDKISKGFTPSFIKQLNCSVHPDHAWWNREISSDKAEARCSAFLELDGGIPDQFALSFYSDILPPVVSNKYGALGWIPTITLTTHIRQMPTTNTLFADFKASDINKGYFEQDCNIWDLNENLVASSRQLTRILKSEEKLSK